MKTIKLGLFVLIYFCITIQAFAQININDYRAANSAAPLAITSYILNKDNVSEILHPDVLYFSSGWLGYKYWLAFTPFPYRQTGVNSNNDPLYSSDATYENPSIVVSNDGINWSVFPGATNPIDEFASSANSYNSDPDLLMSPTNDTLFCFWRRMVNSTLEKLYYRYTTNGITWSDKVEVLSITTDNNGGMLSPAILYQGGKYRLWVVHKPATGVTADRVVEYREATSIAGLTSAAVTATDIHSFNNGSFNVDTWHINMIYHNGLYWIINNATYYGSDISGDLYLGYSSDGIHWTMSNKAVVTRRDSSGNWDRYLYRAAILPVANTNHFDIWYSTKRKTGTTAPAQIGFTTAQMIPASPAATAICHNGFTASWSAVPGATSYRLDVQKANNSFVTGYNNKTVTGTVTRVEGLLANTFYKFKVRAYDGTTSLDSNTIEFTTTVSTNGVSANTSISGAPVTVTIPVVTGGPTFTNNNVTIDPANTASTDFAIAQTWNPSGYDTLPHARLVCSVTASDNTSLNGTYTINHTGMGFVPDAVAYRLGGGTWRSVANTSTLTSTTVTISGLTNAVKGNLIIAMNDGNGTLPVELSSFAAIVNASNFVDISWVSQSETNLSGYYVLRNSSNDLESASVVSRFVPAANSSTQNSYSYTDTDVYPGNWYYWLQSLDMNGAADYFGSLYVSVSNPGDNPPPVIPLQTALQNIYPNPFNPSTTISFDLSKSGSLDLAIYNLRGERICTLRSGNVEKGAYRQTWNGTDDAGRALPTGVYLVRMVADKYVSNRKLVLIK